MALKMILGLLVVLATLIVDRGSEAKQQDVKSLLVDHSPYCKELAKITQLCNEVFIHILCPKTCQFEDKAKPKVCGLSQFDNSGFTEERMKRHDVKENEAKGNAKKNILREEEHVRVRRIVGGRQSVKGAWPWQVALYFNGQQRCGGAILTPSWILTAAHCFDADTSSYDEIEWLVTSGDHSLSDTDEGTEQVRNVKKIIVHHKNYKYWKFGYKDVPDDYDVALLKLEKPLKFDNHTRPICLPGLNNFFESKDLCKIVGWGSTRHMNDSNTDVLREATVKLVPRDICNLPISYNGKVHERAMCAGYKTGHTDACSYDSGGALSCKKGRNWFVVGLVSWGYQCGKANYFGIYTNVPFMKSWIIETLLSYDDETNSISSIFERISLLHEFGHIPGKDNREKEERKKR